MGLELIWPETVVLDHHLDTGRVASANLEPVQGRQSHLNGPESGNLLDRGIGRSQSCNRCSITDPVALERPGGILEIDQHPVEGLRRSVENEPPGIDRTVNRSDRDTESVGQRRNVGENLGIVHQRPHSWQ